LNGKYLTQKLKLGLHQVHTLFGKVVAVGLVKLTELLNSKVDLGEQCVVVASLHQSLLELFQFLEKLLEHLLAVVATSL
jgi:hypothetical protein